MRLEIEVATTDHADVLTELVNELLDEIMTLTGNRYFHVNYQDTMTQAQSWIANGSYVAFFAKDAQSESILGFLSLYESYALYAGGAYGTIPEFYVRPPYRSIGIGRQLLEKASDVGKSKGWKQLEVITPPIPPYEKTLQFYENNGFHVTGGKKLKLLL